MAISRIVQSDRKARRGKFLLARLYEIRQHSFRGAHAPSRAVAGALADHFLNPRQTVCAGRASPSRTGVARETRVLPGSELVVLIFKQDVERGERSVTAGDILLQVELVGITEDNKDTWMLLVSLLDEGASLYGLC